MTQVLRDLLVAQEVGSLGTLHGGEPAVSMVPFVLLPGGVFAVHVSGLASHTQDLRAHPRVSLMIVAPEAPGVPAQARPRVTIQGAASEVAPGAAEHAATKAAYLARFPRSANTFELADFALFRIRTESARFIAGFAQAVTLTAEAFAEALAARGS
jgi:putative heme iron utilization protein